MAIWLLLNKLHGYYYAYIYIYILQLQVSYIPLSSMIYPIFRDQHADVCWLNPQ